MATELRLGLPGSDDKPRPSIIRNNKRNSPEISEEYSSSSITMSGNDDQDSPPPAKKQVEGWPPIRSYRKNYILENTKKDGVEGTGMYVKVSMDGAPYLRKIDLKVYNSYPQLLKALETMFKLTIGNQFSVFPWKKKKSNSPHVSELRKNIPTGEYSEMDGYNGSDYAPTYEDKDGDWMLVGDVPWEMFICCCKRLRIMKGSD
ncbi:hypothetical protein V6N11_001136 [Hibiscus sabdariffa]|uniref:Auxin-responsive protein n=1 Tax=Hibiscus sabdariffa TaxID=183260 RepID=A0ABR2RZ73_9ROSI